MLIAQLINLIFLIVSENGVNALVPRPRKHTEGNALCSIAESLTIEHNYPKCFILIDALKVFNERLLMRQQQRLYNESETLHIKKMTIVIKDGCDESENKLWPSEYMDESHKISILDGKIDIECNEVWGALHALQSIIQLVHRGKLGSLVMYERIIEDAPLYIHRGFLVDTANHYISVDEILKFIDAMAVVKMNMFHWHMTDDSSFPYVSSTYPQLSLKGAYHPRRLVYENADVIRVIEYARLHGIRVMVEFDTPSHTKSWEKSHPEIRTDCNNKGNLGPFNPANETTFEFLKAFFKEVTSVFPEPFIHLGGREVSFDCWKSNTGISNFMKEKQFGNDYGKLESYYFDRLIEAIQSVQPEGYAITPVVSHEVFQNGYRPNKTTVMNVWQYRNWPNIVKSITSAGYRVIVSACWQISPSNQATRWYDYHKCDIGAFGGTEEEQKLVIGGEAVIYRRCVDSSNLFTSSWLEGAVIADRLWSHDQSTIDELKPRLAELRCHMRDLGFKVKPINEPKNCLQP
uniref:Beta-hexosaminidase n=2 Tax=Trichobilharzia regenti TaxID=157069 RepID=A0AA85KBC7_TRIRE|nr:unnamed protein product [Trichobilharzia regenti]